MSLGTHEQPFDRALSLIKPLAIDGHRLVIQHGATKPEPGWRSTEWHEYLDYDEVLALTAAASSFICHAGVGSILTGLTSRRRPIVIPRERHWNEHVDDHQLELATKLAERGLVMVLRDGDDPSVALTAAALSGNQVVTPSAAMIARIRGAVEG